MKENRKYDVKKKGQFLNIIYENYLDNGLWCDRATVYDLNNYEIVKGFTPKELYEMDCPKKIFLYLVERLGVEFVGVLYGNPVSLRCYTNENPVIKYFPWFLENGFIKEKDNELKMGMRLKSTITNDLYIVAAVGAECYKIININTGARANSGNYYGKTLGDLNRNDRFKFEVVE